MGNLCFNGFRQTSMVFYDLSKNKRGSYDPSYEKPTANYLVREVDTNDREVNTPHVAPEIIASYKPLHQAVTTSDTNEFVQQKNLPQYQLTQEPVASNACLTNTYHRSSSCVHDEESQYRGYGWKNPVHTPIESTSILRSSHSLYSAQLYHQKFEKTIKNFHSGYAQENTTPNISKENRFGGTYAATNYMQQHNITPIPCEYCSMKFLHQSTLRQHLYIHTDEIPSKCGHCSRRFTSKEALDMHMCIHTEERSFVCQLCPSKFTRKGHLNRHMRIHTEERPFVCQLCPSRFTGKGYLNRHMRIHTGERPFDCQDCPSRFTGKGHLNRHMRIHIGERPFGCQDCPSRFTRKDDLDRHMHMHTGDRPFGCQYCLETFARKWALDVHMCIHT